MGRILALILFLSAGYPPQEGRTLRIGGRGYSFSMTEPEGWTFNFTSAQQIANFVMHPRGTNWREADVVAFARFVPKAAEETLQGFLDEDLEEFQLRCPFYEAGDVNLEVEGGRAYLTKAIHCPTMRHEIIAVTEVPGYFVAFVLSSNQRDQLQSAVVPFQALLSSFQWFSRNSGAAGPDPRQH